MSENMSWGFQNVWNQSLEEGRPERTPEPRRKIWASELGSDFVSRYLKMQGEVPSNPPNKRSLRKFEAGNIWEAIVGYVLNRAGILQARQTWVQYQYDGLLPVSGKLDFEAGGKPDYEKAAAIASKEFSWLPDFISRATVQIVKNLSEQYPGGLKNIILEIKSCSSFMFDKYERAKKPNMNHRLQTFHYLKAKDKDEAHLCYVSKDDCRLLELGVFNPSWVEAEYRNDIETITGYIEANERPPLEKFIVFDEDWGTFSANYKVGYSSYLTKLYGLKCQKDFDDIYKPMVEKWNRVLQRIIDKKEMTSNNSDAIKEMSEHGFDIEKIRPTITAKGEAENVGKTDKDS